MVAVVSTGLALFFIFGKEIVERVVTVLEDVHVDIKFFNKGLYFLVDEGRSIILP
jgi:hypothetical protein